MNFFPDFAPNSRKEWRLSLFNQICENNFENCRNFWNLWRLFNIIQFIQSCPYSRHQDFFTTKIPLSLLKLIFAVIQWSPKYKCSDIEVHGVPMHVELFERLHGNRRRPNQIRNSMLVLDPLHPPLRKSIRPRSGFARIKFLKIGASVLTNAFDSFWCIFRLRP